MAVADYHDATDHAHALVHDDSDGDDGVARVDAGSDAAHADVAVHDAGEARMVQSHVGDAHWSDHRP